MKRFASLIFALAAFAAPALAQTDAVNGFCTLGASKALTSGLQSSNMQQGIIPKCTVTVYLTGTTTLAPIVGVPGNPFTATVSGQWLFFATTGVGIDIVMSGGTPPLTFPSAVTLTDVKVGGSGGGGGANPGGLQTQMQFNLSPTAFGGAKTTTDLATGMQLNVPILNGAFDASKFQTSPGSNNGIANAEAAAGPNGVTVANPNYPMTETGGFPPASGTLEDRRAGGYVRSAVNPFHGMGLNTIDASGINCYFDENANASATDSQFCIANFNLIAGIGNDAGGGVTRVAGGTTTTVMVANGITAVDEQTIDCWKDGDCHAHRDTFSTQGLNSDLSQEGFGDFMPHYVEIDSIFVSNVTSVTDSTHIKTNPTNVAGAHGTQLGGGWLVKQANIDSGNITADNAASGGIVNRRFTTSTTHAVSIAWGATTTNLGVPSNFVNGDPTSVTVTKIGGTWPASGNVCISGDHTYETTFTGATNGATVTMTIQSRYEEPIGSTIVVGSCTKMFSVPDRQLNFQSGVITSEISPDIIGAPDANTYFYTLTGVATRDQAALTSSSVGQYNWSTDLTVGVVAGGSVTRDASNNISFADDSGNTGTGYRFTGTRTITVASCANSSFNFGPSVVTIATNGNPFNLLFVQPGAIAGAASTTGCTITMSNLNGFTVHKAARVISASDPTIAKNIFPFTGYYQLGTNTAGWTVGDAVEQPSGNSIPIDVISEVVGQTPTLGSKGSIPVLDWSCHGQGFASAGQCSGGMMPFRINNQAPFSQYIGGGGLYNPMTMATVSGVWSRFWNIGSAPVNGGTYTSIGCPPEGCNSPSPWSLFNIQGAALAFTPSTNALAWNHTFSAITLNSNQSTSFSYSILNGPNATPGLSLGFASASSQYGCISFTGTCASSIPDNVLIFGDNTQVDKNFYYQFLHGGKIQFRAWSGSGFTLNVPCEMSETAFDCTTAGGKTGAQGLFTSLSLNGTVGLSQPSAGIISVDTNAIGNGLGTIKAAGFQGTGINPQIGTGTASNTDPAGELAFSAATTASYTWANTYISHPEVSLTPQFDIGSGNRCWVTYTGITSFTINCATAVTGTIGYIAFGRN